ncbi:MAG: LytR/AlgR family response regulator transcription factor [Candidatus Onthomonas sp.]
MQQIVICDDNPEVLLSITRMVDGLWTKEHRTTGLFSWEALERYLTVEAPGQVDILLLDIELDGRNGIKLAQQLQERWPRIRVIYITGHIEYCEEIFQGSPTAFLIKPVKPDKLRFALEKATRELEEGEEQSVVLLDRTRGGVHIPLRQLEYAESTGRMVRIWAGDQTVECALRLDELQLQLPSQFVRCHQSYLVNLAFVQKMEKGKLQMQNGVAIPVSRTRMKETREHLVAFARERL